MVQVKVLIFYLIYYIAHFGSHCWANASPFVLHSSLQVKVVEGILEGEILENQNGTNYYSFKGVPYARPPVGDLRFKAPVPLAPWNGVRSAKEHGPICVQFDMFTQTIVPGSEDCLYLNIYTTEIKPTKPLPVMVWIHGGGFLSGSGNTDFYGPDFLIEKDVILVTINYRLEVLGFLSLDTEDVPGNAGMKDQVAALKWVQKNIHNFGGDPNDVTIFGESAGSVSVGLHLLSPMSRGLFKRVILQSGTAGNSSTGFELRERALKFAKHLGCFSEDDQELYEFYKSLPAENLILSNAELTFNEDGVLWAPVDEKRFGDSERFYYGSNSFEALKNNLNTDVEIIIGRTADEGAFFIGSDVENTIDSFNEYIYNFVPAVVVKNAPLSKQIQVARRIKNYYYGTETKITKQNIKKIIDYTTMNIFAYDTMEWAKMCTYYGYKVYLYEFDYKSEINFFSSLPPYDQLFGFPVAGHGDELGYLFKKDMPSSTSTEKINLQVLKIMTELWTNFAKYGNPTPDDSLNVKWEPFTLKNQEYLHISDTLKLDHHMLQEDIEFFQNLYREVVPDQYPELNLSSESYTMTPNAIYTYITLIIYYVVL